MVTTGAIRRSKLQPNRRHQQANTQRFPGRMPFLSPSQQCQSTEEKAQIYFWQFTVSFSSQSNKYIWLKKWNGTFSVTTRKRTTTILSNIQIDLSEKQWNTVASTSWHCCPPQTHQWSSPVTVGQSVSLSCLKILHLFLNYFLPYQLKLIQKKYQWDSNSWMITIIVSKSLTRRALSGVHTSIRTQQSVLTIMKKCQVTKPGSVCSLLALVFSVFSFVLFIKATFMYC